jgi:aconitase A
MKVAVVGSRNFTDYALMKKVLDNISIDTIVSGGALGADSLAEQYAKERGIEIIIHKPNWRRYGKAAGYVRNVDIVNDADLVVAFWDGKSRGTRHTIETARKEKKFCSVINFNQ